MGLFKRAGIPGDRNRAADGGCRGKAESSITIGYRNAVQRAITGKNQIFIRIVKKIRIRAEFNDLYGLALGNQQAKKENGKNRAHETTVFPFPFYNVTI